MNRVRCAVIGAGGFAETCHVPGLQSHPGAEVVLLCGRNAERRRAMAERLGVPETADDFREVVGRPDIDAITITTPNASHHEIALAAFEAGKHVFCEKPLAMNTSEAETMLGTARQRGLIHQVAFTFRYTHGVSRLRDLLREGPSASRSSSGWSVKDGAIYAQRRESLGGTRRRSPAPGCWETWGHTISIS